VRRAAVFCFSLITIIGLIFTSGCNPSRISITPSTIEVTVGDPIDFSAFKSSAGGNVPYNEAFWELLGDDIGSLTNTTGPTTRVNTDAAGNAQLKASSPDGKVYALASIYVTYVQIPTSIVIDQTNGWSIKHGDTKIFSAKLYDQFNNQITLANFTWAITGGNGTFSPNPGSSTTFTAGDPGTSPDSASVTAAYGTLTSTACTGTISRQSAVLTTLTISPSDSFSITKGNTKSFSSTGLDQYGVAFTPSPTWSASNSTGTFSPNPGTNTTFTATSTGVPKSGVISASQVNSLGATIQSNTVSVTVDDVERIPTRIAIVQSGGWTLKHGETKSFSAKLYDQFDVEMPSVSCTWTITGGNGTFSPNPGTSTLFTAGDPGTSPDLVSITVTYGTLTSMPNTGTITRQDAVLTTLTISPFDSFSITKGNTKSFSSTGLDQYGVAFTPSPTWSASNSTGTFSPNPGTNTTFTATSTGVPKSGVISASQINSLGATIQSNTVPVTVDDVERIPTRIAIVQSSDWTLVHGEQKYFSAKLYDQFDVEMPVVSYTWAITGGKGTFSPNPGSSTTFTAGDPGTNPDSAAVTAAYSTLTSPACTGTISRQASRPSSVAVTPSSLTIYGTESTSFSAKVYDQYSVEMAGEPVIWSITGDTIGTLSSSSNNPTTFTAADVTIGSSDRNGKVWAKAVNNTSIGDDTNVTVKATKTLASVVVSPNPANMTSKTKTITATAYDQYDNTISADSWGLRLISQNAYISADVVLDSTGSGSTRQITITVTGAIVGGDGTAVIEAFAKKGSVEASGRFTINTPKSVIDVITLDTGSISGLLDTTSSTFTAKAWDQYGYFISTTFSWSASNSVGILQYSSSSGSNKLTFKKAVTGIITASAGGKSKTLSATGLPLTDTYIPPTNETDYNIPDNGRSSGQWAVSTITVSSLKAKAYITAVYVEYGVTHTCFNDLVVWADIIRDSVWYESLTYYPSGAQTSTPKEMWAGFTTTSPFTNKLANGTYHLCVADEYAIDTGHIDFFYLEIAWRCDDTW